MKNLPTIVQRYDALRMLFSRPSSSELAAEKNRPFVSGDANDSSDISEDDDYDGEDVSSQWSNDSSSMRRSTFATAVTEPVLEDVIRRELDSSLGRWFVAKMEALFTTDQVLMETCYRPMMKFVGAWGDRADEYFSEK